MGILRSAMRKVIRAAGTVLSPKRGDGANISDTLVRTMDGETIRFGDRYGGKVVLIVNVASKCGFTPQYEALQALQERYRNRGFVVVAFPCNDFGAQEPGTNNEIRAFCSAAYRVDFDLMDKVRVSGGDAAPLYVVLASTANGTLAGAIKWNFTKFLTGRDGRVRARLGPAIPPDAPSVVRLIERALSEQA